MRTLAEAYEGWGYKAKVRKGDFGMEVETEVKDGKAYPVDFLIADGADDKGVIKYIVPNLPKWKAVGDGSLRNFGVEFIFKEPYTFKEANTAIDIFGEATAKIKFIEDAPATSVHVHTNMWDKTFMTFGNYCTLHMLFENVLVEFAGGQEGIRRSNLFSLPTRCAEPTGWNLIRMFEGIEAGEQTSIRFSEEEVKYAAFNLASLTRLGSVENRMMRGTTDPTELKRWLSVLNDLLVFSQTDGLTPRDIISEYRAKGVDFFDEVFNSDAYHLRRGIKADIEMLIDKNLYFAGSIASSVKDWSILGDKIPTKQQMVEKTKVDIEVKLAKIKAKKKVVGNFNNPFDDPWQEAGGLLNQAVPNPQPVEFWHQVDVQPDQPVQPVPVAPAPPDWMVFEEEPDFANNEEF